MAEKKTTPDEKEKFEAAVYTLGLELIAAYNAGTCADRDKVLDAIIEIFKRG